MANKIQLLAATSMLSIAIAFGMQIASAEDAVPSREATPAIEGGGTPESLDSAMESAKKMKPAEAEALMKQLADNPAAAPKGSPAPSGQAGEPGKSSAPQYVPSEVETYIPVPQKVDDPRMVLDTSMGRIKIRLFYGIAPKNVRNVADLARGNREFQDVRTTRPVKRPFYNGLVFHRILSGYLIQTGCPFGNGRGGPGYQVVDEINPALKFTKPGMVAMAPQRGDGAAATPASGGSKADGIKDSNGSQFFITLAPMPDWNEKFTIIGEVESGMDIVRKIGQVKTGPTDRPIKRVFLQSVDIVDPTGAIPSNQSP